MTIRKTIGTAALLCGLLTPAIAAASPTGEQLCTDQRIRHAAGEDLGAWSENFAFAKVLIGTDGKFGDVQATRPTEEGKDFVVCHAFYNLSKTGPTGSFVLAIEDFNFRVSVAGSEYVVTLPDFPIKVETAEQEQALLSRFTINNRPYADILRENQARLDRQGQ